MKLTQRLALRYIRTKFKLITAISKKKAANKAFQLFCTPQSRNRKKLPPVFEKAEKLQLMLNGKKIRGWRFSPTNLTGAEKTAEVKKALIVHGFESSVTNFDRYIKSLRKKGYEVLAFDAPAHGRSEGKTISLIDYKELILQICNTYGPINSFMAHSFGGLALSIALEEISHTENHRVALIAPASNTITAIDSFFKFLKLDPAVRIEFEKIIIKKTGVSPEWFAIKRAMHNIKAKILWHHDEEDKVTPITDALKVQEANYPTITFVFTKGLGHSRIYRDNKVTKAIIDFL